jgi:hypothetical protein
MDDELRFVTVRACAREITPRAPTTSDRTRLAFSTRPRPSPTIFVMSADAKTKGIGFVNVRAFAEERFGGAAGWKAVTDQLVASDRRELEEILPVGWYSLALYARLIHAVDKVHGYGDLSLVVQLGRFEAERDLTTIQRLFLRLASPSFILEKNRDYWRRFHDTGQWTVERLGEGRVRAFIDDWGVADVALCRELVGYVGRLFELVGAKNVRMEHVRCRGRGEARCEFLGRWGMSAEASTSPNTAIDPPSSDARVR